MCNVDVRHELGVDEIVIAVACAQLTADRRAHPTLLSGGPLRRGAESETSKRRMLSCSPRRVAFRYVDVCARFAWPRCRGWTCPHCHASIDSLPVWRGPIRPVGHGDGCRCAGHHRAHRVLRSASSRAADRSLGCASHGLIDGVLESSGSGFISERGRGLPQHVEAGLASRVQRPRQEVVEQRSHTPSPIRCLEGVVRLIDHHVANRTARLLSDGLECKEVCR